MSRDTKPSLDDILNRINSQDERLNDLEDLLSHEEDEGIIFTDLDQEAGDSQVMEANLEIYRKLALDHGKKVVFKASEEGVIAIPLGPASEVDDLQEMARLLFEQGLLHTAVYLPVAREVDPHKKWALVQVMALTFDVDVDLYDVAQEPLALRIFGLSREVNMALYTYSGSLAREVACA